MTKNNFINLESKSSGDSQVNWYKDVYVSEVRLNWTAATKDCEKYGKALISLDDYETYSDFSRAVLLSLDSFDEFTFVGGFRSSSKTAWKWLTGATLNYNFIWSPNEPNNPDGEFCLSIKKNGRTVGMNDIWCYQEHKFICADKQDYAIFHNGNLKVNRYL